MPQANIDFTKPPKQLKKNDYGKGYDSFYPNGNAPSIPPGLTLVKRLDFNNAPLGPATNFPEIYHYSADISKRPVVVNHNGLKVLRHNLNTVDTGVDPFTGQGREGNYTHFFNCSQFYSKNINTEIAVIITHYLDHSYWRANENTDGGPYQYPVADGKLFLEDKTVHHEAIYLGLRDFDGHKIRLVSGNAGSGMWSPSQSSWTVTREMGWKDINGQGINGLDLICESGHIFRTDGLPTQLIFEVRYNPGGIGYHKGRLRSSTGAIYRDLEFGNTDANGWFNLPIEYEFKGARIYSNPIAFTTGRQDVTNNPGVYSGLCGGYNIIRYDFCFGTISI